MVIKKDIIDAAREFVVLRKGNSFKNKPMSYSEEAAAFKLQQLVERYDAEIAHIEKLYRELK